MNSIQFNPYYQQKENVTDPLLKAMFDDNVIPHYPGQVLYKYMPFETARIVLENRTIRFSVPTKFKDGFELDTSNIDYDFTLEDVRERMEKSWEKHPLNKGTKLKDYSLDDVRRAYKQVVEEQKNISLIFCSSVTSTNEHLWKHYADKSRGVCLGFHMPVYYEPWTMMTMHVQYTDQPKPFQFFHKDFYTRTVAMARWVNTKQSRWSDEEEVRSFIPNIDKEFIIPENGFVDIKYDPRQLRELYYGKRMSPAYIKEIKKLLKDKPYQLDKIGWVKIPK
jgi:hypothetical protein